MTLQKLRFGLLPAATPFLKWAGGKRGSVPDLMRFFPKNLKGAYYEPFVGGGALFFHLASCGLIGEAFLGDTNPMLTRTYVQIRDNADEVVRLLKPMRYEKKEFLLARERIRKADGPLLAALTIYLNRTCFNGLWRVNKTGHFNVPFGRYTDPLICDEDNLRRCSLALQQADVRCVDFFTLAWQAGRGDFVYFDPPYWPTSATANFTSYGKSGFGKEDQVRLAECARSLRDRGVTVVLSNADLKPVRDLYEGWELHRVEVGRAINSKAGKRGNVGELIISSKGAQR